MADKDRIQAVIDFRSLWYVGGLQGDEIKLDGLFSADDLRALADAIDPPVRVSKAREWIHGEMDG